MNKFCKWLFAALCCLYCLPACASDNFSVLQMNVWMAGTKVPDGKKGIIDVIDEINPEVALLCELGGKTTMDEIVSGLAAKGQTYYGANFDSGVGILSKVKPDTTELCCVQQADGTRSMVRAVVRFGGKPVAIYSAHTDYRHYACYLPRAYSGATWKKIDAPVTDEDSILSANRLAMREEQIALFLDKVRDDLAAGIPVIIGGDFNEPSHLDWKADMKDLYDHNGATVNWDCSRMLAEAGFTDSFRRMNPDPVKHPGMTFPAGNPAAKLSELAWAPEADERDRIDFIYYHPAGRKLKLTSAKIVGPAATVDHGAIAPDTDTEVLIAPTSLWPSDHRGNLAIFRLQ